MDARLLKTKQHNSNNKLIVFVTGGSILFLGAVLTIGLAKRHSQTSQRDAVLAGATAALQGAITRTRAHKVDFEFDRALQALNEVQDKILASGDMDLGNRFWAEYAAIEADKRDYDDKMRRGFVLADGKLISPAEKAETVSWARLDLERAIAKAKTHQTKLEFDQALQALNQVREKTLAVGDANLAHRFQTQYAATQAAKRDYDDKIRRGFEVFEGKLISPEEKKAIEEKRARVRERDRDETASTFTAPPVPLPPNGQVTKRYSGEAIAPFRVVTRGKGEYYYVKLVDWHNKKRTVVTVFVHGGEQANLDVPLGSYELRYAVGKTWYGTRHLFGPETQRARAERRFDFTQDGLSIRGHTVELYRQVGGNLATESMSAEDF